MLILTFSPSTTHLILHAYVDSDWATRFSASGAAFEFMWTLVHWFSKTQSSVSVMSTEADYLAVCIATRDILFPFVIDPMSSGDHNRVSELVEVNFY